MPIVTPRCLLWFVTEYAFGAGVRGWAALMTIGSNVDFPPTRRRSVTNRGSEGTLPDREKNFVDLPGEVLDSVS